MYRITVKYYNGEEAIFIETVYDKACSEVNKWISVEGVKSIHLKEIK